MARPSAPANVAATEGVPTITITWDAVAEALVYVVSRATSFGDSGIVIGITDALSWVDITALSNRTYYYAVQARSSGGCGESSPQDSGIAVPERANILNPPTNLVVTVIV